MSESAVFIGDNSAAAEVEQQEVTPEQQLSELVGVSSSADQQHFFLLRSS